MGAAKAVLVKEVLHLIMKKDFSIWGKHHIEKLVSKWQHFIYMYVNVSLYTQPVINFIILLIAKNNENTCFWGIASYFLGWRKRAFLRLIYNFPDALKSNPWVTGVCVAKVNHRIDTTEKTQVESYLKKKRKNYVALKISNFSNL